MTQRRKIALISALTGAGAVAVAAVLAYALAGVWLERQVGAILPATTDALAAGDAAREAVGLLAARVRAAAGWMLAATVAAGALLAWWAGRSYARRLVRRIDNAYQSEKAFVRSASHELNNPLTAIRGECEIALSRERTPAEYQIALSRILDETKRIIDLMKHLLFLSRGDAGVLQETTETIFIAEFLRTLLQRRIEYSPDRFSFTVRANPQLLRVAIENIVGNALKYSGDKPVAIRLRDNVLEVEDNGIGIPPEEMQHIFQPFFRASNTRGYAGHGVGLSLALRILSSYGAEITVRSELGKGTLVKIIFP